MMRGLARPRTPRERGTLHPGRSALRALRLLAHRQEGQLDACADEDNGGVDGERHVPEQECYRGAEAPRAAGKTPHDRADKPPRRSQRKQAHP